MFEQTLGGRQNAEIIAKTLEAAINHVQQSAKEGILEQKQFLHITLKEELKQELVTREIFEERFKVVEERFKSLESVMTEKFKLVDEKLASLQFRMNLFIAVALIALTFANPTFVEFIKAIF